MRKLKKFILLSSWVSAKTKLAFMKRSTLNDSLAKTKFCHGHILINADRLLYFDPHLMNKKLVKNSFNELQHRVVPLALSSAGLHLGLGERLRLKPQNDVGRPLAVVQQPLSQQS